MFGISIKTIAEVCNGKYFGPEEVLSLTPSGIVSDSRIVEKGCIYAAITGDRRDGHEFITGAIDAGAICAIAEHEPDTGSCAFADRPYILVENTGDALRAIAEYFRVNTDIKVVGITGSVGKTSTKETIAAVLSQSFKVHKTTGNFNNQLGVPLTMFGLKEEDEILVMELGISHFGDMDVIARIGRPNISVITNIANCHLENLIDRDGVLKEKTEIFKWMTGDGPAILNGDDDKLSTVTVANGRPPVMCSISDESRDLEGFYASNMENMGLSGMKCRVYGPGPWSSGVDITVPVPGRHMISNALMACAVSQEFQMDPEDVKKGLLTLSSLEGRGQIIKTEKYDIINDCYNANPTSMKASLNTLAMVEGHKVAILGDMFELGENEKKLHREVGIEAARLGIDVLICIGERSESIAKGAIDTSYGAVKGCVGSVDTACKAPKECENPMDSENRNGRTKVHCFRAKEEFLKMREEYLCKGDTILVKASHGMHLEEIVEALKDE